MKYGELVTIALQGEFGKPRPALIIQSDLFGEHTTTTVLLLTSSLINAPLLRVTLEPDNLNRLQKSSQVMIDKAMTVRREKIGDAFGFVSADVMQNIGRLLAVFLNIV
jgi:mRNA interferase MazF